MADLIPVSFAEFGNKRWRRPATLAHGRQEVLVGLSLPEMFKAVTCLPLAFAPQGEAFVPVAVLGLKSGQNLFVAPDGRWLGEYVPAALRAYPFRLLQDQNGQQLLGFDRESGLLTEADQPGEPFFEAEGKPAAVIQELLVFLSQMEQGRKQAVSLSALLRQHGLIQPWPVQVQVQGPDGKEAALEGLFRVDEAALRTLPLEALGALRDAGAFPLMYCQLLSMQHLGRLAQLAEALARAEQAAPLPLTPDAQELDLSFLNHDGAIKLGGVR